jgi:hypothetical protein
MGFMRIGRLGGLDVSSFNGGRSQFNPNLYGESMFIDLFKQGQGWGVIDVTSSGYNLDTNGYPRAIPGAVATTSLIRIPENIERAWTTGCYKVWWRGQGTLRLTSLTVVDVGPGVSSAFVSGQYQVTSATDGEFYVTVTPTSSSPLIGVKAVGASGYIYDIKFYYTSDEAELLDGKILSARARQVISELGFGVMRYLDLGGQTASNLCMTTTWDTRRHRDYYGWLYHGQWREDLYVGETTSSIAGSVYTYVIAGGAGGPSPMETIHIKWDRTLASPELGNVAELTYKGQTNRILNFRAQVPGVGQNGNSSGVPYAGSIYTLIYDTELAAWLAYGAAGSVSVNLLDNGIPLDVWIDICKEIGCHQWICMPPMACAPEIMLDTAVSWPYNFDQLIQSTAPSWMKTIWEGPNEPWNNQFTWQKWAPARQLAQWGGRKPQDDVQTAFIATAITSAVSGAVVMTIDGPLPPKGSVITVNNPAAPSGLFQIAGSTGWVTASGSGSITIDNVVGGGFAGSSGASTITLGSPGTVTTPVTVAIGQAMKLTTTGTLPTGVPASGIVYAKTAGTTVQISATNGGAALNLTGSQSGTHTCRIVIAIALSDVAEPDYYGQIQSYLGQLIAISRGVLKADVKTQTGYDMIIGIATRNFNYVGATVNDNARASARGFVLSNTPEAGYDADAASEWSTGAAMANYLGIAPQLSQVNGQNSANLVRDFTPVRFTASIAAGVMTVASIDAPSRTATITIANPAVVTLLDAVTTNQPLIFTTTGALPANIPANTPLYALSDGVSVNVSLTVGGAAISTSGNSQSGTHTETRGIKPGITLFGPPGLAMADGVTVSAYGTGGTTGAGRTGTYAISDSSLSYPTGSIFYGGTLSGSPNALQTALDTDLGCTFNGQMSGTALTVNDTPAGSALYVGMVIRDGLVGITTEVSIGSFGTGTGGAGTYVLSRNMGTISARAMSAQGPHSSSEVVNKCAILKTWCEGFDLDRLYFYEGGLTADPSTANSNSFSYDLFYYALRLCAGSPGYAEGVKTMLLQSYEDLVALSDGDFTVAYPSVFQLDGRYPSNNNYSVMQSIYNDYPPQALAIQEFNAT